VEYREITVRLWGKGVVERGRVAGASISGRRVVAREGQFIASRIDARNGAMGLVPASLDGALVSNDFPLFDIERQRLEPGFLAWLCRTNDFVELCLRASEGTTNRVRLKEERFLGLELPLPPLDEQRRIVARIDAMASRISEAVSIRQRAIEEADALSASLLVALLPRNVPMKRLGEVVDPNVRISYGVLVPGPTMDEGVPFVRVQDLDLRNPPASPNKRIAPDVEAQYARTRLRGGEILIGVVGSIGKLGIAPMSWAGANIARAVCRIAPGDAVDRDYLALALSSKQCQSFFQDATRTLAQPTLNVAQLSAAPVPVPSLHEQRRIVARLYGLQRQMDHLKHLQAETATELDALMPAILDRAFKGEL
jgi:type I restriction enzyme S subunit